MIYLLRHGEITGADTKRFIGRTDVGLSEKGLEQAKFWHEYFTHIKIDRIFSSPLSRCVKTARIVSSPANHEITLVDELREIDLGQWDGQPFVKIKTNWPEAWEARGKDLVNYRPPEGESFSDLFDRVVPAFHKISTNRSENTLIVAHAGVNRMILCDLFDKDLKDLFSIVQPYGCLNLIRNNALLSTLAPEII